MENYFYFQMGKFYFEYYVRADLIKTIDNKSQMLKIMSLDMASTYSNGFHENINLILENKNDNEIKLFFLNLHIILVKYTQLLNKIKLFNFSISFILLL